MVPARGVHVHWLKAHTCHSRSLFEKERTRRHTDDLSELQQRAPPAIHPG